MFVDGALIDYYTIRTRRRDRSMRSLDGYRFKRKGYEYRLTYSGGFAPCVSAERREIGKRIFKYVSIGHIDLDHCYDGDEVLSIIYDRIDRGLVQ